MKKNCVIILLLSISLYSYSAPRVITSPYSPGFWTRHATALGITTAAISNIALRFAVKKQNKPVRSFFVKGASCLLGYLAYKLARSSDLDMLLLDPSQALKQLLHQKKPRLMRLDINTIDKTFIREYLALGPEYRNTFEKYVGTLFDTQFTSVANRPLNYVGFGSDSIIKDFMILTRVLAKNPTAQINIHLIDTRINQGPLLTEKLQSKFKGAKLVGKAYPSIQTYLQQNSSLSPDIVVGVDITDKSISPDDYAPLLRASQGKNVIISKVRSDIQLTFIDSNCRTSKIRVKPKRSWWDWFVWLAVANQLDQ